jgi:hypothetical protein
MVGVFILKLKLSKPEAKFTVSIKKTLSVFSMDF